MGIIYKNITTVEQFTAMAQLEQKVWGMSPIPLHHTITAGKNGGIIIGAYDGEKLIGFSYGFAGFSGGEVYLCSHMMGIDPGYRDQGIGYALKIRQAEEAGKKGYQKIRWTFDPLETRNAYLNLTKLGAICSNYLENCYGEMQDELNRGLPSDRFNVEWLINSPYLESRHKLFSELKVVISQCLLGWELNEQGLPKPFFPEPQGCSEFRFVPAPADFREIRQKDPELAFEWRLKTRKVFEQSFVEGWAAVRVIRNPGETVVYYVLARRKDLELEKGEGI